MNTYDAFRDHLNEHPDDWQAVLALSDYLADNDNRAVIVDGFRCLGQLRKYPWWFSSSECWGWVRPCWLEKHRHIDHGRLTTDQWVDKLETNKHLIEKSLREVYHSPNLSGRKGKGYVGPFVLLKAAALAFSKLPDEERVRLLSLEPDQVNVEAAVGS